MKHDVIVYCGGRVRVLAIDAGGQAVELLSYLPPPA